MHSRKKPSPGWWKENCKQFSAPAPDEGEIGERTHRNNRFFVPFPGSGKLQAASMMAKSANAPTAIIGSPCLFRTVEPASGIDEGEIGERTF